MEVRITEGWDISVMGQSGEQNFLELWDVGFIIQIRPYAVVREAGEVKLQEEVRSHQQPMRSPTEMGLHRECLWGGLLESKPLCKHSLCGSAVGLQPLLASQASSKEEQDRVEESEDKLEPAPLCLTPPLAMMTFRVMATDSFPPCTFCENTFSGQL